MNGNHDTFKVGDLIVKTKGTCTIFSSGHSRGVGRKSENGPIEDSICSLYEYDVAIVIHAFKPVPEISERSPNEHVIRVITTRGIGWTWRGFFERF